MFDYGGLVLPRFDLRDEASIAKSVEFSETVINLIGQSFHSRHFTLTEANVEGPRRIARAAKVGRGLLTSRRHIRGREG